MYSLPLVEEHKVAKFDVFGIKPIIVNSGHPKRLDLQNSWTAETAHFNLCIHPSTQRRHNVIDAMNSKHFIGLFTVLTLDALDLTVK